MSETNGPSGPDQEPTGEAPSAAEPQLAADPARARTPWAGFVAVAAGAALLASGATAGLVWTLVDRAGPPVVDTPAVITPVAAVGQPDWPAVAAAVRPSVVAIEVRTTGGGGQGSGVILDRDGRVLTNAHVAGGANEIRVALADGRVFAATLVGTDPTTDLAVLALVDPPDDLVPAVIGDSDRVAVGAAVMAVGNPLGLDSTVTTGIVSAVDRPVTTGAAGGAEPVVTNAIQVDAAVNPGNSGGPLFDASGRVIGITSSIASLSQAGAAGSIGLGFAIPVNLAQRVAGELISDGTAEHAFLGVGLSDGTGKSESTTRLGAVVEQVSAGSPADKAGLEVGDVVVAIDEQVVNGAASLTAFVREHAAGDQVSLAVVRDGATVLVRVVLTVRDDPGTPGRG